MNETQQEAILSEMGKQITELASIIREVKRNNLGFKVSLDKMQYTLTQLESRLIQENALVWAGIEGIDDRLEKLEKRV